MSEFSQYSPEEILESFLTAYEDIVLPRVTDRDYLSDTIAFFYDYALQQVQEMKYNTPAIPWSLQDARKRQFLIGQTDACRKARCTTPEACYETLRKYSLSKALIPDPNTPTTYDDLPDAWKVELQFYSALINLFVL